MTNISNKLKKTIFAGVRYNVKRWIIFIGSMIIWLFIAKYWLKIEPKTMRVIGAAFLAVIIYGVFYYQDKRKK